MRRSPRASLVAVLACAAGLLVAVATPPATADPAAPPTGPGQGSVEPGTRAVCAEPTEPGQMACLAVKRTDIAPADAPAGYGPADLQDAYDLPSGTGGGDATVAIVDAYDDPTAETDMAVYRARYGLPACTSANGCFRKVDERGGTSYPAADPSWSDEISLDLDMVSAACPRCRILLVEADQPSTEDLGSSVNTAVRLGARYVSNSYGGLEFPGDLDADSKYFDHPGVAITASTGDTGYWPAGLGASYPASSPYVTAVGGTSLVRDTGGWHETAWSGAGSGCSRYEPKPAFQQDTECAFRSVADVAAVADPATGVAVYSTYGDSGWAVYGGTSAASPLIAAMYALAGRPGASDRPNTYPYGSSAALHDVTTGTNGYCADSYLCTAGPGYDGPTGLGTPAGVRALRPPTPEGDLGGTVLDRQHRPVAGVDVEAGPARAVTDDHGRFDLSLPAGRYDLSATLFGYDPATVRGLGVSAGRTTYADVRMTAQPQVTLTGTVHDASGQNWPLYAALTVRGTPLPPTYTDPYTGRYSVTVPAGVAYTLDVSAQYPGYPAASIPVPAGQTRADVALAVDPQACDAPGYYVNRAGPLETFDGATTPAGWTVTDNNGSGENWRFDNPRHLGNLTGGDGNMAAVDGWLYPYGDHQDTTLTTPTYDLASSTTPVIDFLDSYQQSDGSAVSVELSTDGGATWDAVWSRDDSHGYDRGVEQLAIPQAAGRSAVVVRFRYQGMSVGGWWQLDDVFVGNRSCDTQPGALVAGRVTDANTGAPVDGATVSADSASATTVETPDDATRGGGFYWMFVPHSDSSSLSASAPHYVTANQPAPASGVNRVDFALGAGQLSVRPGTVQVTERAGQARSQDVTFTNTGAAATTVHIDEDTETAAMLAAAGAPLTRVAGTYSPHQLPRGSVATAAAAPTPAPTPSWQPVADYPLRVMDSGAAAGPDGTLYSVGGLGGPYGGLLKSGEAYDPASGTWSTLPDMANIREKPAAAFLDGKLYVVGGWGGDYYGTPVPALEIYDPATRTWSAGAPVPTAYAASGVGVVGGKLYVVGGCGILSCGSTDVFAYDPVSNTWSQAADYPIPTSWAACGGIAGQLFCAGGTNDSAHPRDAYRYDPVRDRWTRIADLPTNLWGSAAATADGLLLVSGGVDGTTFLTNAGYAYDPRTNAWTPLPNAPAARFRAAGACGFYRIGGSADGGFHPGPDVSVLPGFTGCGGDVSWLAADRTSFTVPAHGQVTVRLTVDATGLATGRYSAGIDVADDTPYNDAPVRVVLRVTH
jgi:N-acetylneuraminic acid mutarotase